MSIDSIEPISGKEYYVRGTTALLDAVGGAISHIGNVHKYARDEDVPEKTLFIITTDGMENASRWYSFKTVKEMVERQKEKYGWEFIFLGANIDAAEVAGRFGVDESRAVRYKSDERGTRLNYKVMTEMVSMARSSDSAEDMRRCFDDGSILDEIREDYKNRE
jgi:hypothetical protein